MALFAILEIPTCLKTLVVLLVFSCIAFGINLNDPIRGSRPSQLALNIETSRGLISLDPLVGQVIADQDKRKNKMLFAKKISTALPLLSGNTLLIAGWYQNEISYFTRTIETKKWKMVYYENEDELRKHLEKGYNIYYLPEQDFYNNLRFKGNFTNDYALPFPD
jgi:hypothetical protein